MNIAYVRVSTADQNEARQVEALKPYNIEKWFIEKASAKDTDRPKLQAMIDFAREGDTVYIHEFSRLARSTKDLLGIIDRLDSKGVHLMCHKENFNTNTPNGKLMITMLSAISEFERSTLLERQREGIAIAKAAGKFKGRKAIPVNKDTFKELYAQYMRREISKTEMAKTLKISRATLDDRIMKFKNQGVI